MLEPKKTKINPRDRKKPLVPIVPEGVSDMIRFPSSRTDPDGWYTGNPLNPFEKPVQDADDL